MTSKRHSPDHKLIHGTRGRGAETQKTNFTTQ